MINNRITAKEARAFIDGSWKTKLEEIYNGVRAVIETGANAYSFDVTEIGDFSKELVLRELEKEEGYEVILTNGMKSVEFCINWRDDKKFW